MDFFRTELVWKKAQIIADIGSGTGIFTRLLLDAGYEVYAIEPNSEMRTAAEKELEKYDKFHSIAGQAESTTLCDQSVDCITVAQAFHWFDPSKTKTEFKRILKPEGVVVLIWNERREINNSFHKDYESLLLRFCVDYSQVKDRHNEQTNIMKSFFKGGKYTKKIFENYQNFSFAALVGRLLSSSYAPQEGHPQFKPMIEALRKLFDKHMQLGHIRMQYDTQVYIGMV